MRCRRWHAACALPHDSNPASRHEPNPERPIPIPIIRSQSSDPNHRSRSRSRSSEPNHPIPITPSQSSDPDHPIPIIRSDHPIPIIRSRSSDPNHPIAIIRSRSSDPNHPIAIIRSQSPHPNHPIPITPSPRGQARPQRTTFARPRCPQPSPPAGKRARSILAPLPSRPYASNSLRTSARRNVISAISGGTARRIGGPVVPRPALTYMAVFPE